MSFILFYLFTFFPPLYLVYLLTYTPPHFLSLFLVVFFQKNATLGMQMSVRPSVRLSVRPSVRLYLTQVCCERNARMF